jgi:hypothetical protein
MKAVSYDQYRTECCTSADENDLNAMHCVLRFGDVVDWKREGFNVSDRIHPSRGKAWQNSAIQNMQRHQLIEFRCIGMCCSPSSMSGLFPSIL